MLYRLITVAISRLVLGIACDAMDHPLLVPRFREWFPIKGQRHGSERLLSLEAMKVLQARLQVALYQWRRGLQRKEQRPYLPKALSKNNMVKFPSWPILEV